MEIDSLSEVFRELETIRAERISLISDAVRGELGQVLTPIAVARELADCVSTWGPDVRLLDPGAGAGTLSAVAALAALNSSAQLERISITAIDVDLTMHESAERSLGLAADWLQRRGVEVDIEILDHDFLEYAADRYTGLFQDPHRYTHVIMNPPYRKISSDSLARRFSEQLGAPVPNLYAAFMLGGLAALQEDGQLIAITPRSFCNGPYFRRFRRALLQSSILQGLKVFESRESAFSDQAVLQENVITYLKRSDEEAVEHSVRIEVGDVGTVSVRRDVSSSNVVFPDDSASVIHIFDSDRAVQSAEFVKSLPCSLFDLGLEVSTGPVVDFRNRESIVESPGRDCVPLIYPSMVREMGVSWPSSAKKPAWIRATRDTQALLLKAGTYVLVKRFTSKEERRRLIAGVVDSNDLPQSDWWGIENHVNYLHTDGDSLDPALARGIAAFLNQSVVDDFFRTFSGHTQVNASDLRSLRYPHVADLKILGSSKDPLAACKAWVDRRLTVATPVGIAAGDHP